MKILIAGSDLNALLLAKYIKMQSNGHDIYITTDTPCNDGSYTPVDIKENDIPSICDFVKYNQIEFTVVTSELAIINGIADLFNKEGFPIAAPFSEAARVTFFNSIAKKVMYKLNINTPRFGIFDRENIALDYIRRAKFPVVIMNDFTLNERNSNVYKSYQKAKLALQKIFVNLNEKIVIENYIDTKPLYMYFLTDGYNAVPLISVERKEEEDFTAITSPSEKITKKMTENILKSAIFPLLDDIAKFGGIYSGIIGMKLKVQENNFYILEYYNGFQNYDLQVFLSLLNEDLAGLFYEAAEKHLGNRNFVDLDEKFSYTLAVKKSEISLNTDIDDEDYFITEDDKNIIITTIASSLNHAKNNLTEYIETIGSEKINKEIKNIAKEVLRI